MLDGFHVFLRVRNLLQLHGCVGRSWVRGWMAKDSSRILRHCVPVFVRLPCSPIPTHSRFINDPYKLMTVNGSESDVLLGRRQSSLRKDGRFVCILGRRGRTTLYQIVQRGKAVRGLKRARQSAITVAVKCI